VCSYGARMDRAIMCICVCVCVCVCMYVCRRISFMVIRAYKGTAEC
jgi:hypothetical protein